MGHKVESAFLMTDTYALVSPIVAMYTIRAETQGSTTVTTRAGSMSSGLWVFYAGNTVFH